MTISHREPDPGSDANISHQPRHVKGLLRVQVFARWFYRTIFLFLGGNVLASIAQGILSSGGNGIPSLEQLRNIYIVRLAIHFPLYFGIFAVLILSLGISGFVIDRLVGGSTRNNVSSEQMQEIQGTLERINKALEQGRELHPDEQEVQAQSDQADANVDWGEAPDITGFYGRERELDDIEQWVRNDHCQLLAVLGMGGVGKTALAAMASQRLHDDFDYIYWRSLQNIPQLEDVLAGFLKLVTRQQPVNLSSGIDAEILELLKHLQMHRCLIVLDNFDAVLQGGNRAGIFRKGYEGYGTLLQRISESTHRSCLILTSREKPREVAEYEGITSNVRTLRVRSIPLPGLNVLAAHNVLRDKGLVGTDKAWAELIARYSGNPLYLKLVSEPIREVFDGDIAAFLREGESVLGDVKDPLDLQFSRLSDNERQAMFVLAIAREPISLDDLRPGILPSTSTANLVTALDSLRRRSLIEVSDSGYFYLQPIVLEYMTDLLVERVGQEIVEATPDAKSDILKTHALLKTQSKDYIRRAQQQYILHPIIERLETVFGSQGCHQTLFARLSGLRIASTSGFSFAAGNILNLLTASRADLGGLDFSDLSVSQAYLQGVELPNTNFSHARFLNTVFTDTFGGVLSIACNSQGNRLAIGTTTGDIRIWSFPECIPLQTLHGHTDWVMSVAFSPDGSRFASSSEDLTIRLWDIESGHCLSIMRGHTNWVRCIAFNANGTVLASAGEDGVTKIWDIGTGECIQTLEEQTNWVWSVAFHPIRNVLASASGEHTIRLWDITTGQAFQTLEGHTDRVWSVNFSHDGTLLASGSQDRTGRLWDVETGKTVHVLEGHTDRVWSVVFSHDSSMIATTSEDQTVRIWTTSSGVTLRTLQGHSHRVWSSAFSPDGKLLISGSQDQSTKVWDTASGNCIKTLQGNVVPVTAVAWSAQGDLLANGSLDHLVRIWNPRKRLLVQTLRGHTAPVRSVAFSPVELLVASGSEDSTICLWKAMDKSDPMTLRGHTDWVCSVSFSPDGQRLVSASEDRMVLIWNTKDGECLQILKGHTDRVWSAAFSPDMRHIVSSGEDQTVRLWDASDGQLLMTLIGHTDRVWSTTYSPDGTRIASAGSDQTIRIWDAHGGTVLHVLKGHTGPIWSLAFHPNGKMLASASSDQTIRLWQIDSGECLHILRGHTNPVVSVRFSPTGETFASGGEDGTLKLWDSDSCQLLDSLQSDRPYEHMDITGAEGLTDAQKRSLYALGAVER